MSRALRTYGDRVDAGRTFEGFDPNVPVAGFYRFRRRKAAIFAPLRIWYGPPHDPVTGEEMDRSWRWQAELAGELIDVEYVWPACARNPIDRETYDRMNRRREWAEEAAPDSAYADTRRAYDPLSRSTPLPF